MSKIMTDERVREIATKALPKNIPLSAIKSAIASYNIGATYFTGYHIRLQTGYTYKKQKSARVTSNQEDYFFSAKEIKQGMANVVKEENDIK